MIGNVNLKWRDGGGCTKFSRCRKCYFPDFNHHVHPGALISPQNIKFHQSMIIGEYSNERFPCSVCGKSYLRKRHLQRHMRDECIGIPPRFKCDLCPSRFRRKYHMVRHMTSKHGIPSPQTLSVPMNQAPSVGQHQLQTSFKKENFENDFKYYDTQNVDSKDMKADDDWKMKLSLSLISNSLLKERLVNAMPFAYNNN